MPIPIPFLLEPLWPSRSQQLKLLLYSWKQSSMVCPRNNYTKNHHDFIYGKGIYLVTFGSCMRVLLWKDGWFKRLAAINKTMVTTALLMMVFATLDVGLGLRHNLEAFVYTNSGKTPAEEFAQISYWVNVMKFAGYAAQTFIGDGILVRYYHWMRLGPLNLYATIRYIDATSYMTVIFSLFHFRS